MGQRASKEQKEKEQKKSVDRLYDVKSTVDDKDDVSGISHRKELARQLREDPEFLKLVEWALEKQFSVTVDDLCWLRHCRIKPGLATVGILSIDDVSSYPAFKTAFLQKQIELKEMILQAEKLENGGLLTPMIKTEIEHGNQLLDM